jgi:glycosyltransferase involved in cell wall biosynthesis
MRVILTRRESIESPDGVSIFIVSLAQALLELQHEVRIVVGWLESRDTYERLLSPRLDLPIVALSDKPLTGVAAVGALLRARHRINAFQPDLVIHSEAVPISFHGTTVQTVHDLQVRSGRLAPVRRSIRRFSTRRCDHVVATTSELRDALIGDLALPPSRIKLIPKCVDRTLYSKQPIAARERAILHAGTLAYKNPAASVKAFAALNDQTVRLYVTGEVTAPLEQALQALPKHLRSCVTLMGEADGQTVRALHGRVRVASFPTSYSVPVASATVMEAVAAGTPIVGSSSLSRDVLTDGLNGLIVDTRPEDMAACFRAVLDADLLWSRLSAGAAQLIERFDAHCVAQQYLALSPVHQMQPAPLNIQLETGPRCETGLSRALGNGARRTS